MKLTTNETYKRMQLYQECDWRWNLDRNRKKKKTQFAEKGIEQS